MSAVRDCPRTVWTATKQLQALVLSQRSLCLLSLATSIGARLCCEAITHAVEINCIVSTCGTTHA